MPGGNIDKYPPYWAVPFSTFEGVTDFLRELDHACTLAGRPSDGTVDFQAVADCLQALGRPDRRYRSVHVTGTNGKTTVSRMVAGLLKATGTRVGLYTSPHLLHFRERISIDGHPISEAALVDACSHVKAYLDVRGLAGDRLSPFEFLTVAAFFAFAAAKVDYAVIEVGIGGAQDATNVVAPDLSIITNVDYDHMDLLGDRLEHIARAKSGIIKPMTPVVCGSMPEEARAVIMSRAAEIQAPLMLIDRDYDIPELCHSGMETLCSVRIGRRRWDRIVLSSPASFMATNAAHALTAYDILRRRGAIAPLCDEEVRTVFAATEFPASCELLPGSPTVLANGAHNGPAMAQLASLLRRIFEGRRRVLVVSIERDKDSEVMIRHLAQTSADRIIFTRCPSGTTIEPGRLAASWRHVTHVAAEVLDSPEVALSRACQAAAPDGLVVVTGSVQLAGLARSTEPAMALTPPLRP